LETLYATVVLLPKCVDQTASPSQKAHATKNCVYSPIKLVEKRKELAHLRPQELSFLIQVARLVLTFVTHIVATCRARKNPSKASKTGCRLSILQQQPSMHLTKWNSKRPLMIIYVGYWELLPITTNSGKRKYCKFFIHIFLIPSKARATGTLSHFQVSSKPILLNCISKVS